MKDSAKRIYDQALTTFGHLEPRQLMACTIYGEARGEPLHGKIGVGTVILERVDHRAWDGQTIKEVCLWPYQFSCYLAGDRNYRILSDIAQHWQSEILSNTKLQECLRIADGMISGEIPRDPDLAAVHCCQYIETSYRQAVDQGLITGRVTKWWMDMRLIKTIFNHEFYA